MDDLKHGSVGLLRPFPKDFGLQVFTHSNDHPPPHVHIQRPPGSREVRYRWPELTPLKGETPLAKSGEKALREYVDVYGKEIERRIREVYPKK